MYKLFAVSGLRSLTGMAGVMCYDGCMVCYVCDDIICSEWAAFFDWYGGVMCYILCV